MGANLRNAAFTSRRFAPCYMLAGIHQVPASLENRINIPLYKALLGQYQITKVNSQNGKAGHENHVRSIKAIKEYLSSIDEYIPHNF